MEERSFSCAGSCSGREVKGRKVLKLFRRARDTGPLVVLILEQKSKEKWSLAWTCQETVQEGVPHSLKEKPPCGRVKKGKR